MSKSYEESKYISKDILTSGAEMFMYLNFCPNLDVADTFPAWIQFYENLFQTNNPRLILMTLSRLLKTSQRGIAVKLLNHVSKMWNLKFDVNKFSENEHNNQTTHLLR